MSTLGAMRSRTAQFVRYRDQSQASRRPFAGGAAGAARASAGVTMESETGRLLGAAIDSAVGGGEPEIDVEEGITSGSPAWIESSDAVSSEMARIRARMVDLGKAYSKSQLTSFDDTDDGSAVEVMTVEITRMFKRAERKLKQLEAVKGVEDDKVVRKNVVVKLASQLRALSMDFRKMQKQYLARLRAKESGAKGGASSLAAYDESLMGRGGDSFDFDDDVAFTDSQMARLKESEMFSLEREKEIEEIVKSVNDLAQVMKDLGVLIIDQGTVLDRIDYNMTQVAMAVEEGHKELQQAEKTQKRGRMFLCIMCLFVACVVMALILVLKNIF